MKVARTGTYEVPKAAGVVMCHLHGDPPITAEDHAVFNYLLVRNYWDLAPGAVHRLPVADVLDYANIRSPEELQRSLERLGRTTIEIDYEDAGEARSVLAHFLSYDLSRAVNGMLDFAFDPIVLTFLRQPKIFAMISERMGTRFKSLAAARLHETMQMQYGKRHAVQHFTVEEIRAFFQVGDAHHRFDNLKRNVIEKAVEEVNAGAEFEVVVTYNRGGRGGAVQSIQFEAVSKNHSKLIASRAVASVGGRRKSLDDKRTIDMLDGMNYEERGGPATISPDTFEAVRKIMSDDDDVNALLMEWRESTRGRALVDPDKHFVAWVGMRSVKLADPVMREIDGDVFGSILDGVE